MADTSCDRLVSFRDYLTNTYNKYIYEGAFSRINPFYSYAREGLKPVDNPGRYVLHIDICMRIMVFL